MTQRYLFFNSVPGDPRIYQASDFASYFGNVLSSGVLHIDNVPGLKVKVIPSTLQTAVEYGGAIIRGYLYENTEDEVLTHSIPESSLDRIDRIVLRLDSRNSERNILLHIKEGNPASNPVPPVLQRDNFIYELSLAQVRVRANTSSLQASDLKDERLDKSLAGLVYSLVGNSELQRQLDEHKTNKAPHIIPALKATNNNSLSIPSGAVTPIYINSVEVDTDSMQTGQTTDKIVCKTGGLYFVQISGTFASNNTGKRGLYLYKNDISLIDEIKTAVNGSSTPLSLIQVLPLVQGDVLSIRAFQDSGNALNISRMSKAIFRVV